jgi:DNA-directed RNA polymerase specialized sigma24 family protein
MSTSAVLDLPASAAVPDDERELNHVAFTRLLEWLDDGVDSRGATYLEMRRRLTSYFDRRNRPFADDLADETLSRIGRTLQHDGEITVTPPARYCYVVARFVFLEDVRREYRHVREQDALRLHVGSWTRRGAALAQDGVADSEARLECLDRCLQELEPKARALVVEYYRDVGRNHIPRRRELARALGISMNALGIRVCRIRAALVARMADCRGER